MKAKDEMKNSSRENQLRFLLEAVPHKIFTVTPAGKIDYVNSAWTEYLHPLPGKIKERDLRLLMEMHPDDLDSNLAAWEYSMQTGERFHAEQRLKRFDGEYRWHLTRIFPIRNDANEVTMWAGSTMDINYQKQLSERKDEFIAMASHELKTPVTTLTVYAQMLEGRFKKKGDEESAEVLGKMVAQLKKLTSLVGDLLDVSKIQAGKIILSKKEFSIQDLVRDVVKNIQSITETHTIFIKSMADATVYGDQDRIGQILINLLTNAIKYSPKNNKIYVSVEKKEDAVYVSVKDFGIGIDDEKREKIFERFYQGNDLFERTYPGLGIGLYISSEIAHRHKGKITVTSKRGRGSTFCLILPLSSSL